ncbi:MAG: hypothetical protein HQL31_05810 [Planctomycetes bacterium]|nr:hypothetical protein [Planctomycetota bacterium]
MIEIKSQRNNFFRHFGLKATLHSFAPGRINLLGEHVDYLGGKVLPAAIDKGISAIGAPAQEGPLRIFSLDLHEELCWESSTLNGPVPEGWQAYPWGVLKELAALAVPWHGGQLMICGDLPAGAGLSSSAALNVALIDYFLAAAEKEMSGQERALLAQRVENRHIGTACGIMDPFASIHGEIGKVLELDCQTLEYRAVALHPTASTWILLNSMVSHKLGADYNSIRAELESAREKLGGRSLVTMDIETLRSCKNKLTESEYRRASYVIGEIRRTAAFIDAMQAGHSEQMGILLRETHQGLSRDLRVSTPELDALVEIAEGVPGWYGGRMMGGGFGGCTLNLVASENSESFLKRLRSEFQKRFGMEPLSYPVTIGAGASVELLEE